jgi:AraC-like DNA-binding protein
LLRDSALGIGEIAERVGYDSDATFNRAFRRIVGSPPSTWRQAATGGASLSINEDGA